jgi:molecular chaperone GrpE
MTTPSDFFEQTDTQDEAAARPDGAPLPAEPAESAIRRLEDELAQGNDRYLRLAAEFDNYRRRATKEKSELSDRAQAGLVAKLLDALDDLHRAVTSDPASTPVEALRGAIEAVDMKVWKELQAAGLERIDPVGQRFRSVGARRRVAVARAVARAGADGERHVPDGLPLPQRAGAARAGAGVPGQGDA